MTLRSVRLIRLAGVVIAVSRHGRSVGRGAGPRRAHARHSAGISRATSSPSWPPPACAATARRKTEGDLRLDTREGLLQGRRRSGAVVVPRRRQGQPPLPAPGRGRSGEAHAAARRPSDGRPDRDGAAVDRRRARPGRREWSWSRRPRPRRRPRAVAPGPPARGARRSARLLQPRRAADPGRQLLRLPRPRSQPAGRWTCGSTARRSPRRRSPSDDVAIVPGHPETSALIAARHRSGRAAAHAPRLERQAAPERGADRDAPPLDRAGRARGSRTGRTSRPRARRRPPVKRRRLAAEPGRRLRARRDREGRASRRRPRPSAASCCAA